MTPATIERVLFDLGVSTSIHRMVADGEYATTSTEYLFGPFAAGWAIKRDQMLGAYKSGKTDCDDYARACAEYAQECYRETKDAKSGRALAFGEFWYVSPQGPHAINFAFVRDHLAADEYNDPTVVFFEPQTASSLHLRREETASCLAYRI